MICPNCKNFFQTKGRSNPQNNAYWALIVTPLSEHLSLSVEECHELLKYKFNKEILYVPDRTGHMEEIVKIKSTTSMTTVEFEDYCMHCRIWGSQLGCYLKEPNEAPMEA